MKLAGIKQQLTALAPIALTETDYAAKGFHLDVQVAPEQVSEAAELLDRENFFLETITGVDWLGVKPEKKAAKPAEAAGEGEAAEAAAEEDAEPAAEEHVEEMEVVYDYNHFEELCRVVIRTRIPRANPELPTICRVFPGANWHERETHDFFGIRFAGHPDLSPLLLPDDADFHPLRKDFNK